MDIYLSESGGIWSAYMDPRRRDKKMDIYLAEYGGMTSIYMDPRKGKKMGVYIAGTESRSDMLSNDCGNNLLKGTKLLASFFYCNPFTEEILIPSVSKFMLDSGAFTFFSSGKHVDWDEYINKYCGFINKHNIKQFFELDIDSLVGYDRVKQYRRRIESLTNKQPIPVWHKSRGKDEFIKMCKDYDYVAIGGIVSKEISRQEWKYFPWFIDTAHKYGAKIHGLGFTSLSDLPKYHFDSVDSTSWTSGNRFGTMYLFDGKTMTRYNVPEGMRIKNARECAIHNFKEWVKFQEYASRRL